MTEIIFGKIGREAIYVVCYVSVFPLRIFPFALQLNKNFQIQFCISFSV